MKDKVYGMVPVKDDVNHDWEKYLEVIKAKKAAIVAIEAMSSTTTTEPTEVAALQTIVNTYMASSHNSKQQVTVAIPDDVWAALKDSGITTFSNGDKTMVLMRGHNHDSGNKDIPVVIQSGKMKIHVADDGKGNIVFYLEGHKPDGYKDYINKYTYQSSKMVTITFNDKREVDHFTIHGTWSSKSMALS